MNRNQKIAVALVACLALAFGASTLFVTIIPVTDYGDLVLYGYYGDDTSSAYTASELVASSVLNAQDDYLVVWLKDDPTTNYVPTEYDVSATLRTDSDDVVRVSGVRTTFISSYQWLFDLTSCPQGTFTYHVYFSAPVSSTLRIGQESFTFTIKNAEAPSYEDAEITASPAATIEFGVDEIVTVSWKFVYDGPCVVFATVDDVKGSEQTFGVSSGERTFNHFVNTTVVGTQEIFFTVDPDAVDNLPVVSDPVTVIIGESATTTTPPTTTPTTTTPTTTPTGTDTGTAPPTTTDGEPPEEPSVDFVILGAAAAGAVLIIIFLVRRRR